MEGQYYPIPKAPQYIEEIRRIRNSDPPSLDKTVNPVIEALIRNIAAVKQQVTLSDATSALLGGAETVDEALAAAVAPAGSIVWYAATTPPPGYLICDGSAVSRTDYARLFEAIGTTFGKGDGETTFALPDLRAKFIRGAGAGNSYNGTFGSTQEATYIINRSNGGTANTVAYGNQDKITYNTDFTYPFSVTTSYNLSSTGYNVHFRPYNISLTPIIKY